MKQSLKHLNLPGIKKLSIFFVLITFIQLSCPLLKGAGAVDTAFDPNASIAVYSLVVQADGKILVGGDFTSIGGQARTLLTMNELS